VLGEVLAAAIGAVAALAGSWLKSRADINKLKLEHEREDHNHRQAYYHDLLVSEEQLREVSWHTDPLEAAGVQQYIEQLFKRQVKGVRTFGTAAARSAAKELDEAWEAGDEEAMKRASERLEEAATADVAPS
jgi:hypothetical protein